MLDAVPLTPSWSQRAISTATASWIFSSSNVPKLYRDCARRIPLSRAGSSTNLGCGSERLEALAHKHPGTGDRLVGVAGQIRKFAMVLDVSALIPTTSEGPQEGASTRPLKRYVM